MPLLMQGAHLSSSLPSHLVQHLVGAGVFPTEHAAQSYLWSLAALTLLYYTSVNALGYNKRSNASMSKEDSRKFNIMQSKKRSWILTGSAALVMTVCSIPSTWSLAVSGFDVAQIPERPMFSQAVIAFFIAYLNLDLVIGCLHYRRQISLTTGWLHHSGYTILLWMLLRRGLCHVFAGAAIMELPTFVLALSMLVPAFRSDLVFTSLFFVTRILYHVVLLGLYWSPYGRSNALGLATTPGGAGSMLPAFGLTLAAPLHISWFSASVRGLLRRRRAAARAQISMAEETGPAALRDVSATKNTLASPRPRLMSMASSYLASPQRTSVLSDSLHSQSSSLTTTAQSHAYSSRPSNSTSHSSKALRPFTPLLSPTQPAAPPARPLLKRNRSVRSLIEHEVRQFFARHREELVHLSPRATRRWIERDERDERDVFKAQAVLPLTKLKWRAGRAVGAIRDVGVGMRGGLRRRMGRSGVTAAAN